MSAITPAALAPSSPSGVESLFLELTPLAALSPQMPAVQKTDTKAPQFQTRGRLLYSASPKKMSGLAQTLPGVIWQ
jgi:hypothetical protein